MERQSATESGIDQNGDAVSPLMQGIDDRIARFVAGGCVIEEPGLKLRPGDQQLPEVNDHQDIQSRVIADIRERREVGISRYGTALQPFNGRDALRDLYEELLDATMYIKQVMVEQEDRADVDEPLLGLATTEQLLEELYARAEVGGYLDYRTVDEGKPEVEDITGEWNPGAYAPEPGTFIPGLHEGGAVYVTGTGQVLRGVHKAADCQGRHCVIHDPSGHNMSDWPTNFRTGDAFDIKPPHMERICPHGVGHPDPDDAEYWRSRHQEVSVHGCDGCCRLSRNEQEKNS